MPAAKWTTPNFWTQEELVKTVEILCLLPNGIIVPLRCNREATLSIIKRNLFDLAASFPAYNRLMNLNFYNFQCVNESGDLEELLDEKRRLSDIKPVCCMLRVVIKAGDAEEKVLNSRIGLLIGKGLHEFDNMKNQEVLDFRKKSRNLCMTIQKDRMKWGWEKRAVYLFPPQLESTDTLQGHVQEAFKDNQFLVSLGFSIQSASNDSNLKFGPTILRVGAFNFPSELIKRGLRKILKNESPDDYVLKVRSREDFLLSNYPLCQYKYIRRSVIKNQKPELILVHKKELKVEERFIDPMVNMLSQKEEEPPPLPSKKGRDYSWNINEPLKVIINSARNINVLEKQQVRVKAAFFHGDVQLCPAFESRVVEGPNVTLSQLFTAELLVKDLPRMAKFCLCIYSQNRKLTKTISNSNMDSAKTRKKKDIVPIAWVNTTCFDYNDLLRSGRQTLAMWPATVDLDLNPLGTVESNPNTDDATIIEVTFTSHVHGSLSYPPFDFILQRAAEIAAEERNQHMVPIESASPAKINELREIVEKNVLEQLTEQDIEVLWKARQDCLQSIPHSLPRLLTCMKWNSQDDVAQMQALLQIWRKLPPEEAMELLDYKYPDLSVRKFAVNCLKSLTDDQLSQYLLQFVQALKYENYLDCDLGRFLLKRALANQRIGHFLFWHLRAEMHQPAVSTRFGLMLESYCRGSIAHMKALTKQVESLNKMKSVNELIKSREAKNQRHTELRDMMKQVLQQDSYSDALSDFISPLHPSFRLKKLRLEKCKYMNSKMRPLWLVFENEDPNGDDISVIFKNGDDLRQDMLTLQVMQIMDNIWQEKGLDLRVIPYKTLATGNKVGLIEVVTNSETIANIQKQSGSSVLKASLNKKAIFEWLKKHNTESEELDRAIEDFTVSCAGYCVATYILGIGDRHNDNIMVKKTGQLFHIDFGHFLGNYKRKFGVKRERVPFVLTNDFVHVITRGKDEQTNTDFNRFKECSEEAFMILRGQGNLLINLFAMMLSAGIPELSEDTITYLHDTLVLDMEDAKALEHFRGKFTEAMKNSWKTSVNWMMHNIAHKGD